MSTSSIASPPRHSRLATLTPALICAGVLVAAWQVYAVVADVNPRVLPAPSRVLSQGWTHRDALADHAAATLSVTLLGFAISLALAWAVAIAIDFSGVLRRALVPMFVVSQTLPIIAIAPLLIIWFGFGLLPKIIVVVLTTFFPMAIGLIEGFAATDRDAGALLRSMGASRWAEFRYVRLPSALPRFFTALRIGITYAVVGAVFAEYVGSSKGLGIYMAQQKNVFRTDLVLAAVLVTACITLVLFAATYLVERIVAPWALQERR
jgi:ABC-type nitrate/sulfonate/bicarbonate transport system permease component